MRSMYPPLVGLGHLPLTRSMSPQLVGFKSLYRVKNLSVYIHIVLTKKDDLCYVSLMFLKEELELKKKIRKSSYFEAAHTHKIKEKRWIVYY